MKTKAKRMEDPTMMVLPSVVMATLLPTASPVASLLGRSKVVQV